MLAHIHTHIAQTTTTIAMNGQSIFGFGPISDLGQPSGLHLNRDPNIWPDIHSTVGSSLDEVYSTAKRYRTEGGGVRMGAPFVARPSVSQNFFPRPWSGIAFEQAIIPQDLLFINDQAYDSADASAYSHHIIVNPPQLNQILRESYEEVQETIPKIFSGPKDFENVREDVFNIDIRALLKSMPIASAPEVAIEDEVFVRTLNNVKKIVHEADQVFEDSNSAEYAGLFGSVASDLSGIAEKAELDGKRSDNAQTLDAAVNLYKEEISYLCPRTAFIHWNKLGVARYNDHDYRASRMLDPMRGISDMDARGMTSYLPAASIRPVSVCMYGRAEIFNYWSPNVKDCDKLDFIMTRAHNGAKYTHCVLVPIRGQSEMSCEKNVLPYTISYVTRDSKGKTRVIKDKENPFFTSRYTVGIVTDSSDTSTGSKNTDDHASSWGANGLKAAYDARVLVGKIAVQVNQK